MFQTTQHRKILVLILTIISIALVLRIVTLSFEELWYDELQSVTHAFLPLTKVVNLAESVDSTKYQIDLAKLGIPLPVSELILSVLKHDPHPPLYYIQLHLWMLFGTSDFWIKLNSVFWSMFAIISLFLVSKKIWGSKEAIFAIILLSLSPFSVAYAQEARMYSMMMCLGIWSFFFAHQFLYSNQTLLMGLGLLISTEMFLYSHGAAFMLFISLISYAVMYFTSHSKERKKLWHWISLQMIIFLLYTPWLIRARAIRVDHTAIPGLNDMIRTLFILMIGFGNPYPEWVRWSVFLVIIVMLILLVVYHKKAHEMLISFVIIPIIFCIIVSYLIRPIWHYRTLAYITPFLMVAIALFSVQLYRLTSIKLGYKKISLDNIGLMVISLILLSTLAY